MIKDKLSTSSEIKLFISQEKRKKLEVRSVWQGIQVSQDLFQLQVQIKDFNCQKILTVTFQWEEKMKKKDAEF